MYIPLIQVFSLNVFYDVLKEMYNTQFLQICNWETHFKGDENTKNNLEMDFFGAFFGPS
jgi:hypothetical protein